MRNAGIEELRLRMFRLSEHRDELHVGLQRVDSWAQRKKQCLWKRIDQVETALGELENLPSLEVYKFE